MPRGDEEQQQLDKVGEEEETEDVPAGDQAKLAAALHGIKEGKEAAGKQVTIKLDAEDIKLVMKEMDMSKDEAELALRENGGDVAKALASAVRLPRTAFMVRQHAVAASSGR